MWGGKNGHHSILETQGNIFSLKPKIINYIITYKEKQQMLTCEKLEPDIPGDCIKYPNFVDRLIVAAPPTQF